VVLAIIGIVMTMVFYNPTGSDEKKYEYNSRSRLFFIQLQNVYSDYSLDVENGLAQGSQYALPENDSKEYILIMAKADKKGGFSKVDTISADKSDLKNSFKILLNKFETDSESDSEKRLREDISVRFPDIDEGYFFALVDEKNRVEIVHYKLNTMPTTDFNNNLNFIEDYYTSEGIVGTYSGDSNLGIKGSRIFNLA